jgi:hypothetical protein
MLVVDALVLTHLLHMVRLLLLLLLLLQQQQLPGLLPWLAAWSAP